MLSVSSSLRLSVTLDKENSVGEKGQVRPWLGACRTAQIREPVREILQIVVITVVRKWDHLFIYSFILRAQPICSEMFGRIKFPEFSLRLKKFSENSLSFPGFPWFFPKKSLLPGFHWAVRTLLWPQLYYTLKYTRRTKVYVCMGIYHNKQ